MSDQRGLFERGDETPGADPAQYVRREDPTTSHEAAARAAPTMGRRTQEVVDLFTANKWRWIERGEFSTPTCGGQQGDRRLRDAADKLTGFDYEARFIESRWMYRATLVNGLPQAEPEPPAPRRAVASVDDRDANATDAGSDASSFSTSLDLLGRLHGRADGRLSIQTGDPIFDEVGRFLRTHGRLT